MQLSRVLLLLFAVVMGLYVVPRLLITSPAGRSADVADKMPLIESALNDMLSRHDGACLYGKPYIIPGDATVTGPFTGADAGYLPRTCDRCDDLTAAGLLDKTVTESSDDRTGTQFTARFRLTPFGREVYSEDIRPSRDSKLTVVQWKFCFGETRLYRVDETLPPVQFGGNTYVGVKYTSEVVNPLPFLFDPKSSPLRLDVPSEGSPALNAPRVTSIVFYPEGDAEVDDAFRYGKFVNQ